MDLLVIRELSHKKRRTTEKPICNNLS